MSEFVEKIIEEKGEEVKKDSIKYINAKAKEATERMKHLINELKEKAKIVLPVNIMDILVKGGQVYAVEYDVPHPSLSMSLDIGGTDLLYKKNFHERVRLKGGKYRIFLILEPIDKDC
jgi:hypothetical protein